MENKTELHLLMVDADELRKMFREVAYELMIEALEKVPLRERELNASYNKNLELKIKDSELPIRIKNVFRYDEEATLGDLAVLRKSDLLKYRNVGALCQEETIKALRKYGIELNDY